MRERIACALLALALLGAGGCGRAPEEKPAAGAPAANLPPSLDGAIDAEKALALLYGPYDAKLKAAHWRSPGPDGKDADAMQVSPLLAQTVREGESERFYLATAVVPENPEEPFDCEGCAPSVGLSVFLRTGERWVLESHAPELFDAGMNGHPPSARLVATGAARYDVLFEWSFGNRGVTENFAQLAGRGERGPAKLFSLRTASENGGDCGADTSFGAPCYAYEIELAFSPVPQAQRHEIRATAKGSFVDYTDEKKQARKLDGTAVYRFNGTKYALVSRPRDWPEDE